MPNEPPSASRPSFAEPYYIILFESAASRTHYQPIVDASTYTTASATLPYGLDRDLVAALPALWYCLHLPRTRLDFLDVPVRALKAGQQLDLPHRILLLPVPWPEPLPRFSPPDWPALILAPEVLRSQAEDLAARLPTVVDIVDVAALDLTSLHYHWQSLYRILRPDGPRFVWPSQLHSGSSQRALLLPTLILARQLKGGREDELSELELTKSAIMEYSSHCQVLLSAIARLEKEGVAPRRAETILPKAVAEERYAHRCPVALLLPGVSPATATHRVARLLEKAGFELAADVAPENTALEFLVAHRAAARLGVAITASPVSGQAFRTLGTVERMFDGGRVAPRKLRSHLDRLSQEVVEGLTAEEQTALLHASSITSFSEFPIGLVTIPPYTSPLCCRTPIAYRPLIPLTRALQFEMNSVPMTYLRDKLAIVCLECIPPDDPVGRLSRLGWKRASEDFPTHSNTTFDYIEVDSVEGLRQSLHAQEYDIAVISAHGFYDRKANRTGFLVGLEDRVVEEELGDVPPLVCLSACQVAPRGSGSVNISDLLFRQGAIAVLGTLVPIDVRRNAQLMVRFFVYIAETLAARSRLRTIDEIWQFAAASNAVLDVAYGAPQAANLLFTEWSGRSGLHEFMLRRSAGRLRPGHIYADTEAILQEMAAERGKGAAFKAWLSNQGYVPESIFYVFLGWPERFVVHDRELEEARRWYSEQL